ncbi:OB-fold putative lipoprotein [Corallococcus sp. AS-1-12]|nr:OB-fold putative lipoprotein [Corallococcus sp. AS-1-12]
MDIGPLLREYSANELQADDNYRCHLIKTSEWAESRGRDPLGNVFLVLASASGTEPTKLHCFIPEKHAEKVASLSQGAHITIRGPVSGLAADKVVVTCCELVGQ